ncbi:MAG: hypothetical protein ABR508_00225, partial [Candidatus Baltobacteraceae bacterium]
ERRSAGVRFASWQWWAGGVLLFGCIVLPWFAALAHAAGSQSVAQLIGYYTIGRFTGTIENQSGPFWYYVPALILGFFPWIAFLPAALAFALRRVRERDARLLRLALVWAVVPLVFFSFAKTKLPNYIALEMPALAILTALYFKDAVARARSRSLLLSTAAVPAFILLLGIAIALFSRQNKLTGAVSAMSIDLRYLGIALFAGSVAAFALLWRDAARRVLAPYVLGAAMIAAMALVGLLMLPQAEALKPIPHLARAIDARRGPQDRVAIIDAAGGNALMFYTRPGIFILKGRTAGRAAICRPGRTFLIAKTGAYLPQAQLRPAAIASWAADTLYLYTKRCGRAA